MQNEQEIWERIFKCLNGECSPEEAQELQQWRSGSAANQNFYQKVERVHRQSAQPGPAPVFDTDSAWQRLKAETLYPQTQNKAGNNVKLLQVFARVAAVVLLGAGLAFALFQLGIVGSGMQTASTKDQKQEVLLADGTRVWLNRHSTLHFPEDFSEEAREVRLKGEAFFEVAEDPAKPFRVHSGGAVTEVLGTSFNLNSYQKDEQTSLVLVTGKVRFSAGNQQIMLQPGEKVVLQKTSGELQKLQNPDPNFMAWKTGDLVFKEQPMAEVLQTLERHFAVEIELQNQALRQCPFTGTFQQAKLAKILDIMQIGSGLQWQEQNGVYQLSGGACN